MGSNMQRQAVPLVRPETPIVMTGVEAQAAQDSGQVILAEDNGVVLSRRRAPHPRPLRQRRGDASTRC